MATGIVIIIPLIFDTKGDLPGFFFITYKKKKLFFIDEEKKNS